MKLKSLVLKILVVTAAAVLVFPSLLFAEEQTESTEDVSSDLSLENQGANTKETTLQKSDLPVIKIIKIKDDKALILISKKYPFPKVGDIARLMPKENSGNKDKLGDISREKLIGLLTSYSSFTTKVGSVSSSANIFNLNLIYGWNSGYFEYGPILNYSFDRQTLTDQSTLELGGLIDFNFNKNIVQNDWIYGVRLTAAVGQQDNSVQTGPANTTRIEPGFLVKWFGLSTNFAAVASVSYRLMDIDLKSGKQQISGVTGQIGFQTYF